MQQQQEQEERDREDWNRRSHILPLSLAMAVDEIFDNYWPPQIPSPEPEPEVPPPVKAKGKKK